MQRTAPASVPLVQAKGSRYAIGFEHGRQVRDLVRGTLGWSLEQVEAGGVGPREARRHALALLDVVQASTPDLVDEVRGIADGAGLSIEDAAVINTRYELLVLSGSDRARPHVTGAECTLFGLEASRTADGQPIIGQNVDLRPESRPYWIMLDVTPDGGPRVLTATLAGMLAQEGINSHGLALCGSMVRCAGWRKGYPTRKFLRRRVLEQPTVEAGAQTIRATPSRASSHNLLLADASGRVADIETTVDEVQVLAPHDGILTHANHYLCASFQPENRVVGDYLANTRVRCDRMREQLECGERPLAVDDLVAILGDHANGGHAICRHAGVDDTGAETNVAVISEPAQRRMHVAFGPPCETAFTTYELTA